MGYFRKKLSIASQLDLKNNVVDRVSWFLWLYALVDAFPLLVFFLFWSFFFQNNCSIPSVLYLVVFVYVISYIGFVAFFSTSNSWSLWVLCPNRSIFVIVVVIPNEWQFILYRYIISSFKITLEKTFLFSKCDRSFWRACCCYFSVLSVVYMLSYVVSRILFNWIFQSIKMHLKSIKNG